MTTFRRSDRQADPFDEAWRGSCRSPKFAAIMVICAAGTVAMCVVAIIALPLLVVAGVLLLLAVLDAFTYTTAVALPDADGAAHVLDQLLTNNNPAPPSNHSPASTSKAGLVTAFSEA